MFEEYNVLAQKFAALVQGIKKEEEENKELAKSKGLSFEEKMVLDKASYAPYHKRMKEIEDFITQTYGANMYFEFCQSVGWGVHNGAYQWVEGIGPIDVFIVELIKALNERGFLTKFSCSGVKSEHEKEPYSGYIMFGELTEKQMQQMKKLAFKHGFFVMLKEKTQVEGMKIIHRDKQFLIYNEEENDEAIKNKWQCFYEDVLKL